MGWGLERLSGSFRAEAEKSATLIATHSRDIKMLCHDTTSVAVNIILYKYPSRLLRCLSFCARGSRSKVLRI